MEHNRIRELFLDFFKRKKHTIVGSDSLVPAGDPTVLFTSAGMNQFKGQFLGNIKGFTRAASCQKCLRTADLENVGKTAFHHTFFEMLGNFSFGDYFKEDAIRWSWEFMTKTLKLPAESLWVSVFVEDNEAYKIWKEQIKVPQEKIIKLGDKENFWPSEAREKGPNGPCGPCSEIFFDYGEGTGCGRKECDPSCDCGRFVEVWNLVFTQYERKEGGILEPLPSKNIDTGMGLERLCAVMQGVKTNFKTDLFAPIIESIESEISRVIEQKKRLDSYKKDIYAIADHIRAVCFAISDGIVPSNEERGYVIRNLIRKASLNTKGIGVNKPILYKFVPSIATVMQEPYPEVKNRRENISQIILHEEEKFRSTVDEVATMLKAKKPHEISAEFGALLYGTYGYPLELIEQYARKKSIPFDRVGTEKIMEGWSQLSREKSAMHEAIFKVPLVKEKVEFTGYDSLCHKAKVIKLYKDEKEVKQLSAKDKQAFVVLDKSPFYGESGGQTGDAGRLVSKKVEAKVVDSKKEVDAILLDVAIGKGTLKTGDTVEAVVDEPRRLSIAKNHTATHILQSVLRKVLGGHVQQQGSLVAPHRLRFDFTHFKALTDDEIKRIQQLVGERIKENSTVCADVMDIDEAKAKGALAFFADKYEKKVRMMSVGNYSKELCGGTHVNKTGEIGLFKIISEGSVASGVRRIEAVTGDAAKKVIEKEKLTLNNICKMLNSKPREAEEKIRNLLKKLDDTKKTLKNMILKKTKESIDDIIKKGEKIDSALVITARIDGADLSILRNTIDVIRERLKEKRWVCLLISIFEEKINMILAASKSMTQEGFHSGKLIKEITKIAGGSGGGRADMAQAGARNINRIEQLLNEGINIIKKDVKK